MVYIISEICGQWGGSMRKAEQMILQSKFSGADAVKIQLYDTYEMPGKNRKQWEYLNFTKEQFLGLSNFCKNLNIDFFASCFQEKYFKWILQEDIKINKIASSTLNDKEFCKKMLETGIKTYASLGHWQENELPFLEHQNLEFFHCISKYPHTYQEAINSMPNEFNKKSRLIGYSDHTIGIESCIESVRRGAKVIEKHFTLDTALQRPTESAHICSMDWKELEKLRKVCDTIS